MGERRDEESILRALSSSAKILALEVLASLKFSKLLCACATQSHAQGHQRRESHFGLKCRFEL